MSLQERQSDLIQKLFIDSADNDYLTARWAFQNALPQQALWSTAQAFEKYFKSILLYNGLPVRKPSIKDGHNLDELFQKVIEIDSSSIIPTEIQAPHGVNEYSQLWDGASMLEFVTFFNVLGAPEGRYGIRNKHISGGMIYAVDTICMSLRKLVKHQNFLGEDLWEVSCRNTPFYELDNPVREPKCWMIATDGLLERLHNGGAFIGHHNLKSVFSDFNHAFFEDKVTGESMFAGIIEHGSPLFNHLVRARDPQVFENANSVENIRAINQLTQWVDSHISVASETKFRMNKAISELKQKPQMPTP